MLQHTLLICLSVHAVLSTLFLVLLLRRIKRQDQVRDDAIMDLANIIKRHGDVENDCWQTAHTIRETMRNVKAQLRSMHPGSSEYARLTEQLHELEDSLYKFLMAR